MKKAITPIISIILLIMLVVAITGGAWYWINNVQGSLQESAGANVENVGSLGTTSISLISATCNVSEQNITITILNTGSASITSTDNIIITVSNITGVTLATDTNSWWDTTNAPITQNSVLTTYANYSSNNIGLHDSISYNIRVNVKEASQTTSVTCS